MNEEEVEYKQGEKVVTACEHYWTEDSYQPANNLLSLVCTKCWSGMQVDGDTFELKSGKVEKI